MFGLELLIGNELKDISRELSRQNDLKEYELHQPEQQNNPKEWIDRCKRLDDSSIIELLNNTPETITYTEILFGGISRELFESGEISEPNEKYIDIKNECLIRNLIKL